VFQAHGFALPATPEQVCDYIDTARTMKQARGNPGVWEKTGNRPAVATINMQVLAISVWHQQECQPDPCDNKMVRAALSAYRKERTGKQRKAPPITLDELHATVDAARRQRDERKALRDAALLLFGFYAGLRESELVSVEIENLDIQRTGILLFLPKSKTDPGFGAYVPVPRLRRKRYCPTRAIELWIAAAGRKKGKLFFNLSRHQSGRASLRPIQINDLIKELSWDAGIRDKKLTGHSLRVGCATALHGKGNRYEEIAELLRHSNTSTTRGYVRTDNDARLADAPTRKLEEPQGKLDGAKSFFKRIIGRNEV